MDIRINLAPNRSLPTSREQSSSTNSCFTNLPLKYPQLTKALRGCLAGLGQFLLVVAISLLVITIKDIILDWTISF